SLIWMGITGTLCTTASCRILSPSLCSRKPCTGQTGTRARWRRATNTTALDGRRSSTPPTDHSTSTCAIPTASP
ncbi:hypothetical protein M9458_020620, partial [Cirrhinus mrigala]